MATLALGGVILGSPPAPRPIGKKIKNIAREFERYFGSDTKLENWVRLCRDVGIEGELPSISKCKQVTAAPPSLPRNFANIFEQALKRVWVNIHDLIHAVRNDCTPPRRFPNQHALAVYTRDHNKYYPKKKAKEGGPVRALLAHIF
jgi:hypothetical protein